MTMNYRQACEVLGVPVGVSDEELKKRYRHLVREFHTDVSDRPDAKVRFQDIAEAHDVVIRAMSLRSTPTQIDPPPPPRPPRSRTSRTPATKDESFPGDRVARRVPRVGQDLVGDITLSITEAFKGVEAPISFQDVEGCPACGSTGGAPGAPMITCPACQGRFSDCQWCAGDGLVPEERCDSCLGAGVRDASRDMTVNVPRSVRNGAEIVTQRAGPWGMERRGDLVLRVTVGEPSGVHRRGDDVDIDVPIGVLQAVLGGTVSVQGPSGDTHAIRVRPGTPSGLKLRIKGQGMWQAASGPERGDLYAVMSIVVPTDLTERQRHLYQQLLSEEETVTQEEVS